ncbi:unnamed protein product [Xylocopa violacea]|uniref:Aquaporin n=1 Tax=Xylocopa violacea TaxID=135666 RepID=A0ABP1NN37_XYLVO
MEQGGISIIPTSGMPDTGVGKSKSVGISIKTNSTIQTAKEKFTTPRLISLMKEDATGWETLTVFLSEAIGTAILVFVGCTGCIGSLGVTPTALQIALTFGLAVMIAIQSVGHVSGAHINPAITVASVILGKKSLPMCVLYIGAQCLGALMGYSLLTVITPSQLIYADPSNKDSFCMTDIHEKLTVFQGVVAELIATGILVFFACGLWDIRNANNSDSVPIRFGFCVAVLCMIFGPYSGCSMNPARTLGPAVWNGYWHNHWVYWIGPIGGSIVASLIYRCLFHCRTEPEPGQFE